jgi:hypothetical protein
VPLSTSVTTTSWHCRRCHCRCKCGVSAVTAGEKISPYSSLAHPITTTTTAAAFKPSPCTVVIIPILTAGLTDQKGGQVPLRGQTAVGQGEGSRAISFSPLLHVLAASASIPIHLTALRCRPSRLHQPLRCDCWPRPAPSWQRHSPPRHLLPLIRRCP